MDHATDDDDAAECHDHIKAISQRIDVPLPELSKTTAAKLDPLNRFRTAALEEEAKAATSPIGAERRLLAAAENWMKAGDKIKASAIAERIADAIKRDKEDRRKDYRYEQLAELYALLGMKAEAIASYQSAIEAATTAYRKSSYVEAIENLQSEGE
jgi:tetratricopeptide (TPR) repeat protein